MKIAIDPGHGMSNRTPGVYDSGAVAQIGGTTFQEADIALRYGLALRDKLKAANCEVFVTREDANDAAPVGQRAHNAEMAGCNLFVSLHLNSSDTASANGVEVLYRRDTYAALATKLRDSVAEATDLKPRAIVKRMDLAVLKFEGPAVLIELGFITSDRDRAALLNPAIRDKVCENICTVLTSNVHMALAADAPLDNDPASLSDYALPSYGRKILGPNAEAIWAATKPVAGMNFYRGIVRDSFRKLASVPGLPNGAVFYESKFDIDGDGTGGNDSGDDTYQPNTSLHDANDKPLNARTYPFIVLPLPNPKPGRPNWSDLGIGLGDLGVCVFKHGEVVPVLYGDQGPNYKLGEGSMMAAAALGINPDPNNGGIGPNEVPPGICHIVFPGTRKLLPGGAGKFPRTQDTPNTVKSRSEALLTSLAGWTGAGLAAPAIRRPYAMATEAAYTGGRPATLSSEAALSTISAMISQTGKAKVIVSLGQDVAAANAGAAAATSLESFFVGRDTDQAVALAAAAREESGDGRTKAKPTTGQRVRVYPHLGLALGQIDHAGLAALATDARVTSLVPAPEISLIRPQDASDVKLGKAKTTWGLDILGVPELWDRGIKGSGVLVGHLDTGVDASHPALRSAVEVFAEFDMAGDQVPGAPARDSAWHGTHTAGTIAGRTVAGVAFGVAPEARLVSAMVIEGGQVIDRILAGMDWIVSKKVRILSMSLGLRGYTPAFEVVIAALRRNGVLPVVAAGNEGPDTSRSPGNYPNVLSIGAIDDQRRVATFSSSQRFMRADDPLVPDIVGPGVGIVSSAPGGQYKKSDGTSMATPHIAGLAALLMSASPNATIDDIESAILRSCSGISPQARANRGLPQALLALQSLPAASIPAVQTAKAGAPKPRKKAKGKAARPKPAARPAPPPARKKGNGRAVHHD